MVKSLPSLIAALLLGACATTSGLRTWENAPALGMSVSEVTRLAGTPDRIEQEADNVEAWVYDYDVVPLASGATKAKHRVVLFKDGRVVGHRVAKGTTTHPSASN